MSRKIIGIIGGMGPLATTDLFTKIVKNTPAKIDEDHIHTIIDSYPQIPNRTDFLLNKLNNPIPALCESALRLQNAGADFLIMACNTAHYFYEDIKKVINIPFINMIDEVAKTLKNEAKVGLLATKGVYLTNIYNDVFKKYNINIIEPTDEMKNNIMFLINNVKNNTNIKDINIKEIIKYFNSLGVNKIVLGCTELPIAFESLKIKGNFIDSTKVLALSAIKKALNNSDK